MCKKQMNTKVISTIEEKPHTRLFANCKGVFQGGGCKAMAYVGAYEEAIRYGVGFSEFAGTSAGSIIASFASAGASPEQMKNIVSTTDFSILLAPTNNTLSWKKRLIVRGISKFLGLFPIDIAEKGLMAMSNLGLYDSSPLYHIVDQQLCKMLGIPKSVRFSDLPFPLSIVASDIKNHEMVLWSTRTTPNEIVAKAVQCSCAVPGVFRPVDSRYVDGGLLCNLPTILFSESEYDFDRILAFSFAYKSSGTKNKLKRYFEDLLETTISGATKLQQTIGGKSSVISISTELGLLDFNKFKGKGITKAMKNAFNSGALAVREFISKEQYDTNKVLCKHTILSNKEQIWAQVSINTSIKNDIIIVAFPNLGWVKDMFLLVNKWREDDTAVNVFVEKRSDGDTSYMPMVRVLLNMGVTVNIADGSLPIYGYFFKRSSLWTGIPCKLSLVKNTKETITNGNKKQSVTTKLKVEAAKNLGLDSDSFIIESLISNLYSINSKSLFPCFDNAAVFQTCTESEIEDLLRTQTELSGCQIKHESVDITKVQFQKSFILGYSYRGVEYLASKYSRDCIFGPAKFIFAGNKDSYLVPITVVVKDNQFIVVTGHVRLYFALHCGFSQLRIITIRGYDKDINCTGYTRADKVKISDMSANNTVYTSIDKSLRFVVERAFRQYSNYLK